MLPCSRSRAGHHLKSTFATCADSARNEPLLFLYPQWLQSKVRDSRRSYTTQLKSVRRLDQHCCNGVDLGRIAVSSREAHSTSRRRNKTRSYCTDPNANTSSIKQSRSYNTDTDIDGRPREVMTTTCTPSAEAAVQEPGETALQQETQLFRHAGIIDVLQSLRDNKGRTHRGNRASSKAYPYSFNASTIDGLGLKSLLAKVPIGKPHQYNERLRHSPTFLHDLTGTSEETKWYHRQGSGCTIVILAHEKGRAHREVLLYGSRLARTAAKAYLETQASFLKHNRSSAMQISTENSTGKMRSAVFWEAEQPRTTKYRVEHITPPKHWSIRNFYEYVRVITSWRQPRLIERKLYPEDNNYNRVVATILRFLFTNLDLQEFQSTAALLQALNFCRQGTELGATSGCIWNGARDAGILPDIACFNAEIDRCLMVNNISRVSYLCNEMTNLGVRPDMKTWALVLRRLKDWKDRLSTIGFLLQNRRIFSASEAPVGDKRVLAQVIVEMDLDQFVEDGGELSQFNEHMEEVFGSGWLSSAIVKGMIQQCIGIGKFNFVSDVLTLAATSKIQIDREITMSLVKAASMTGHLQDLVMLLKTPFFERELPKSLIGFAFEAAWSRRMANMCRVLWFFAASHGHMSMAMQTSVVRSLERRSQPYRQEDVNNDLRRNAYDEKFMAAITIHVGISISEVHLKFPALAAALQAATPVEYLCRWVGGDKAARHEQLQLMHLLIEQNLNAWERFEPMRISEFQELLDAAYKLDETWIENDALSQMSISRILQQALMVDLQPLPSSRSSDEVRQMAAKSSEDSTAQVTNPMREKNDNETPELRIFNAASFTPLTYDAQCTTTSSDSIMVLRHPTVLEAIFQLLGWRWRTV